MSSLEGGARFWSQNYDWTNGGEEWSATWGGSEAQWFGCLYPRLHRLLPANSVLEIGTGYGRWTKFLLPLCAHYIGVDIAQQCIEVCSRSFSMIPRAVFFQNDGLSLNGVPDDSIDLVFSFDSLVHSELDVFVSYTQQILRKLTPTGVAFLHHSNVAALGVLGWEHGRGTSVSGERMTELIDQSGGKVLVQEVVDWAGETALDCLTLFGKAQAYADFPSIRLNNSRFMDEAVLIAQYQSHYSRLPDIGR